MDGPNLSSRTSFLKFGLNESQLLFCRFYLNENQKISTRRWRPLLLLIIDQRPEIIQNMAEPFPHRTNIGSKRLSKYMLNKGMY